MSLLRRNIEFIRSTNPTLNVPEDPTLTEIESLAELLDIPVENLFAYNLFLEDLPFEKIKFIFLDVDGVMTEGGMFYTDSGDEFKRFDTKDGMAIKVGMQEGLVFGIISSGVNEKIIRHRADMFGIEHVYVGTEPKLAVAESWLNRMGLSWSEVGYIGDDINDLALFEKAGIAVCPSDATVPIKKAAHKVLMSKGGHGCIREFMRFFPQLQEKL